MCSHLLLFITLNLLQYARSEDCILRDYTSIQSAWDRKLHTQLMLHYKSSEPPRNGSCVPVKVLLILKSFSIDVFADKFIANVWTRRIWIDERLTWSPDEYGGISQIVLHSSDIWTPNLIFLNTPEEYYYDIDDIECTLKSDGQITCVDSLSYESFCTAKLKDWPYDIQNCTLQFGKRDRFDVTKFYFHGKSMILGPAEYGNGWNIMAMDSQENLNAEVQLWVSLIMERQAGGLVVVTVVPCFIVSVLTSVSNLLNVYDTARWGLLSFSLMSHFVFTKAINEFIPIHSVDTPVIFSFFRGSLILTLCSIFFTYVLRKIVKRKSQPFQWVYLMTSKVFDSFGTYLIVPRWHAAVENDDANLKHNEIWNNFGNILNSIYLVITVIVYITLFSVYMPKLPPNEY